MVSAYSGVRRSEQHELQPGGDCCRKTRALRSITYDDCTNAAQEHCGDAATRLANLGLLPFASEESAPMPVIVSVRTVVVRSGLRLPGSGVPCAHRERVQSDQGERLKRIFEQIAAISDGVKRRSNRKATSRKNACAAIESVNRCSTGHDRRRVSPYQKSQECVNERAMDSRIRGPLQTRESRHFRSCSQ